ncbi:CapA family protein [Mycolicibacterium moriokaense]|uniref:CapA family protein n=1 Tax=Mycolicibacterium moriokaense TaxID=39691 RepID=UPI0011B3FEB6|nr:CapA family protein [Mycolicibacterium moriokaense]
MTTLRVLAASLVVAVASLTACARDESEFTYLRIQVDGQPTLAITRKDARIRGIVVYFHGIDGNEFSMTSDSSQREMTRDLVDAGFAVVSSFAGGNAFGDQQTVQNYRELGSMAHEHYQIDNVYFLADGLGAIPAINLFASGHAPMRGLAAINPVLNLTTARTHVPALSVNEPSAPSEIGDPMALDPEALQGKDIRFYVSPQDSDAPSADNATLFERRFGGTAKISVVGCSGAHRDASCVQGEDLARWFTQLDART